MKKPRCKGMTNLAREAAKELDNPEGFSRGDLYDHIEKTKHLNDAEEQSLYKTIFDLHKRGEFERIGYGRYRYVKGFAPVADVRQKILRAMHVKGAFCATDIKILTDADKSYILVIIRRLKKAGYLDLTGKSPRGNIFRVKHPEKFYLEMVHGETKSN